MSKLIKLFLLITLVLSTLPSHAMFLRAMHRLPTNLRPSMPLASRTIARPVFSNLARRLQPMRFASTTPNKIQFTTQSQQHSSNYRFSRAASCLAGLGAIAGALYVGSQLAHVAEEYLSPFEKSKKKYYADLKAKPWGKVAEKYIKQFEEEEQQLMAEFFGLFKDGSMNKNVWKLACYSFMPYYQKHIQKELEEKLKQEVLPELKEKIERTLANLNLDLPKIYMIRASDDENYSAAASAPIIYINQAELFHIDFYDNDDLIDAVILHELQHILHNDSFLGMCLDNLSQWKNLDKVRYQEYKRKWSHLMERRADILAVLACPKYAQARCELFEKIDPPFWKKVIFFWRKYADISEYDERTYETRPSFSTRKEYFEQVRNEMLEAIEQKNNQSKN